MLGIRCSRGARPNPGINRLEKNLKDTFYMSFSITIASS